MPPSVLIVGGGFAGLTAARQLGTSVEVTVVSDQNFLLFTPMLAEVASGDLDPRHIITPVRQLAPHARFIQGEVTEVDIAARGVSVLRPLGLAPVELKADALLLTPGSVPADFGIPGVSENTLPFKTIGDAIRIRNRVLALAEAATEIPDPSLTSVAVVGAGYSGAEVAASLADFLTASWRKYFASASRPRVTIIDAIDRVTPALPPRSSRRAATALSRRGVEMVLGSRVASVERGAVVLESGARVEAATVVWSAGVKPHPMAASLGLPLDKGRLVVDHHLRAAPGIFAAGDFAISPRQTSAPTAQMAIRQGKYLGRSLPQLLSGGRSPQFAYRSLGELVSLGHRNAVGLVMGVPVSGFIGWFAWRSYYLWKLPTLLRKARVALDWTLDLIFPPDVAWLPSSDLGPTRD